MSFLTKYLWITPKLFRLPQAFKQKPLFFRRAHHAAVKGDGRKFVAHNVDFDARFLRGRLEAEGVHTPWWPTLCTVRLSRRLLSEQESFRLDALADGLGIPMGRPHRATSDADAAAGILLHIVEDRAAASGISTVGELLAASRGPARKQVG